MVVISGVAESLQTIKQLLLPATQLPLHLSQTTQGEFRWGVRAGLGTPTVGAICTGEHPETTPRPAQPKAPVCTLTGAVLSRG